MPRMTVHMFGIMFFDLCNGKGTVVVPNGRDAKNGVPPHYASFFVEDRHIKDKSGWKPEEVISRDFKIVTDRKEIIEVPVTEFRIPSFCEIEFPPHEESKPDLGDLEQALVHMRDIDPEFTPDFTNELGGTIATVPLKGGFLRAFRFNRNVNAVQWRIRTGDAPLIIKAGANSFELKERRDDHMGTELVFTNAPELLPSWDPDFNGPIGSTHAGNGHSGGESLESHHFSLYGKINLGRGVPQFPSHRSQIPFHTAIMSTFQHCVIESDCTPPCCTTEKMPEGGVNPENPNPS